MLCSNCSQPIRPVVAVDIDGTLGDYHGHFISFAETYLGRRVPSSTVPYIGSQSFKMWFREAFGAEEKDWHDVKLAYRQGGMKRSMPIFEGAHTLIEELKRNGVEIWVTTTRPYLSLDNIVPDTVEWLSRHGIVYDGMLFDEDKYQQLVQRVDPERIVCVIDDLPEQCDAANEAVGRMVAVLAANPYNAVYISAGRASLWDIAANVGEEIDRWKEFYGNGQ